ncbi:hypothetical protein AB0A73_21735 [Glycomyces sp. NPDC047369]
MTPHPNAVRRRLAEGGHITSALYRPARGSCRPYLPAPGVPT